MIDLLVLAESAAVGVLEESAGIAEGNNRLRITVDRIPKSACTEVFVALLFESFQSANAAI